MCVRLVVEIRKSCPAPVQSSCWCLFCSQAMQQILSGSWNYSLSLGMFANPACTQPLDLSGGIQTDQTIYMSMDTDGLDGNIITLVVESCFATNSNNKNSDLRYDLVKNGWVAGKTDCEAFRSGPEENHEYSNPHRWWWWILRGLPAHDLICLSRLWAAVGTQVTPLWRWWITGRAAPSWPSRCLVSKEATVAFSSTAKWSCAWRTTPNVSR